MTSTGFHVAWVADLALRPTFQLTLMSTRSPAVRLETWNTSLQLWGLEPGVLHLVEIVAKACRKDSARAHLKVRTGKGLRNANGHLFFEGGEMYEEDFSLGQGLKELHSLAGGLLGFHWLLSVETSGSLHTRLAWDSRTEGGSLRGKVLGGHCKELQTATRS